MVLSNNYVNILYKKTHNATATVVFMYMYVCMYVCIISLKYVQNILLMLPLYRYGSFSCIPKCTPRALPDSTRDYINICRLNDY